MTNDEIFEGWCSESQRLLKEGEPYINRQGFNVGAKWAETKIIEKAWSVLFWHFNSDLPFEKEWFFNKMKE